jgi:hypothetical protein
MSGRDVDQILGQLGGDLRRAYASDRRRLRWPGLPRLRRRGGLIAAGAVVLALVPTAVATRETLWAPDPPPLPQQLRPADAVAPGDSAPPVYVATGTQDGVAWRLSATGCSYGDIQAVGLFLAVPGGGAGVRCDVASTRSGLSPQALAARRVQTYYDPVSQRTWAFGAVPAASRSVVVESRAFGGGTGRTDVVDARTVAPEAIEEGHLPEGLRVFVVALPGARDVARVVVRDDAGAVLTTCTAGRCDR